MNINIATKEDIDLLNKRFDMLFALINPRVDLTVRKGVREYLGITDSTLSVMMNDGRLKQGVHFTKELKGKKSKITFVESAIRELKG